MWVIIVGTWESMWEVFDNFRIFLEWNAASWEQLQSSWTGCQLGWTIGSKCGSNGTMKSDVAIIIITVSAVRMYHYTCVIRVCGWTSFIVFVYKFGVMRTSCKVLSSFEAWIETCFPCHPKGIPSPFADTALFSCCGVQWVCSFA
jgi:hypothetical protein